MKRMGLIALVLVLVGAGTARGETLSYPGQEPVSTPLMRSLETVADKYWAAREVTLPVPVAVWRLPMETVGGEGELGGSQVWIRPSFLNGLRSAGEAYRVYDRIQLCKLYLHERGHNAGLTHEAGFTIMRTELPTHAPPRCLAWGEHPYLGAK